MFNMGNCSNGLIFQRSNECDKEKSWIPVLKPPEPHMAAPESRSQGHEKWHKACSQTETQTRKPTQRKFSVSDFSLQPMIKERYSNRQKSKTQTGTFQVSCIQFTIEEQPNKWTTFRINILDFQLFVNIVVGPTLHCNCNIKNKGTRNELVPLTWVMWKSPTFVCDVIMTSSYTPQLLVGHPWV